MVAAVTPTYDEGAIGWLERLGAFGQRIVFVRDADRVTTYVSPNVEQLTGWCADELSAELFSIIHPEDMPMLMAASRAIRTEGAVERRFPARAWTKDGTLLEFDVQLLNRLADPAVAGMVVVLTPMAPIDSPSNRWTALLALSNELLIIQRPGDPTDFVSPSAEQILGLPASELPDRWLELVHPDDVEDVIRVFDGVATGPAREARLRVRVRHADGHLLVLDTTIANHSEDALINGIILRARDISDLVATERALDRSNAWFETVVTNGPGATLLLDEEPTILFASAGIEELVGWTPDEIVGKNTFDFIHPDDLRRAAEDYARLFGDPPRTDTHLRLRRADGHHEWIGVTGVNRLDDPDLEAIIVTMRSVNDKVLANRRIERVLRDSTGAAFVVADDAAITWSTPGVERFVGDHRILSREVAGEIIADGGVDAATDAYWRVLEEGPDATARVLVRAGPGDDKGWVDISFTNARDDPAVRGVIVNVRDVDEAVRAGESGHRLAEVLENTSDLVCMYDRNLQRIWANAAAVDVFGPQPPTAAALERHPEAADTLIRTDILNTLAEHRSWRGELTINTTHGRAMPIEATLLTHEGADGEQYISLMGRDISERKRLEGRLRAHARHDPLTGLPNRLFLSERLDADIAKGRRFALLFLDLDQFKAVNDSEGHDAGDRLLVVAAERLRAAIRPTDLVARFGGDEFVILLPDVTTEEAAVSLAARVLDQLRGPAKLGAIQVYLTGSVGIALGDGSDANTVISNADAAMYRAKAEGRDRVAVFTDELRAQSVERLATAHTLRRALEDDDLEVWFQPIVETSSARPIAVEALARWRHPDLGSMPVHQVIEVAEETGLILGLGAAVIRRTCEAIAAFDSHPHLSFSVNLSAQQLTDPHLIDALGDALAACAIDPGRMLCEITESAVMLDVDNSAAVLDRIRALGIGIAIDDFGTGYSSLAYLQRFPVDVLKIDREFVSGLTRGSDWRRSLAAGIVSLGHSLGLQVVAEGVEEQEQANILSMLGCDSMQGFLYAPATPPHELSTVLGRLHG